MSATFDPMRCGGGGGTQLLEEDFAFSVTSGEGAGATAAVSGRRLSLTIDVQR